jgi:hypothetical protein
MEGESVLQKPTDFSSVFTVAVTYREEMAVFETHNMWRGDVSVLIRLSRVMRSDSSFGREGELGHNVADLAFACGTSCFLGCGLALLAIWCFGCLLLLHLLLHHQLLRVGLNTLESLALS